MSRLHILGSCSGTEPMLGRHHTALALEHNGALYFFDAGEGCAHTAHVIGLDLLQVRHIFLTHPHQDHVGGLGHLLWTIRKLVVRQRLASLPDIHVHTPSLRQFSALLDFLGETEGGFTCNFAICPEPLQSGRYELADDLLVEAQPNCHLGQPSDGIWRSFSFRITCNGKRLVFSGDVSHIRELDNWTAQCDWLLMETGHHAPVEVCRHLREREADIGNLLFVHHGRELLERTHEAKEAATAAWGKEVLVAYDRMVLTL